MKSNGLASYGAALVVALVGYFIIDSGTLALDDSSLAYVIGVLVGFLTLKFTFSLGLSTNDNEDEDYDTTTLYVGNLPYRANEEAVKSHFLPHGHVESVRLMKDRRTGKRKGYGFVEMASRDAERAINSLNDTEFQERTLKVRLAKDKANSA